MLPRRTVSFIEDPMTRVLASIVDINDPRELERIEMLANEIQQAIVNQRMHLMTTDRRFLHLRVFCARLNALWMHINVGNSGGLLAVLSTERKAPGKAGDFIDEMRLRADGHLTQVVHIYRTMFFRLGPIDDRTITLGKRAVYEETAIFINVYLKETIREPEYQAFCNTVDCVFEWLK